MASVRPRGSGAGRRAAVQTSGTAASSRSASGLRSAGWFLQSRAQATSIGNAPGLGSPIRHPLRCTISAPLLRPPPPPSNRRCRRHRLPSARAGAQAGSATAPNGVLPAPSPGIATLARRRRPRCRWSHPHRRAPSCLASHLRSCCTRRRPHGAAPQASR